MEEMITMSGREQRRAWVLSRVEAGEMGTTEAARLLGLSERSVRRLRARFKRDGPAGLVHGNRGRPSPRRVPAATRTRILELVATTHAVSTAPPQPYDGPVVAPCNLAHPARYPHPVTDLEAACAAVHDNTPPGWYVGRPMEHPERAEWSMYAFDTAERPIVGKRSREWTSVGPTELRCLQEMARCLGELREERRPK